MRLFSPLSATSVWAITAFFLAGCAVGPDFVPPVSPDVNAYDSAPLQDKTADDAQDLHMGQDIPSQWWELFHSRDLNALVAQALKDNPDLASAEAALRVAEDNLSAGGAALFPVADGAFSSSRQRAPKVSTGTNSTVYTLHNASVGVSYTLDLWGGTRRSIEQLQAAADQARFQKEAAYLALTANVVTTAIQEASLRDQIKAMRAIIADQEKILQILKARFEAGAVDKAAVLQQQSAVAAAKTQLPPLEHQRVASRHALQALIGQLPTGVPPAGLELSDLKLPAKIPLSLPSRLVEQRPDVRMAQENMHAASAAIGVAVAQRLPNIILSADIGTMARVFSQLFSPGGGFWSFGASASEILFDAGALADKEQAARDAFDAAAAQYRKAVLSAFQNVADTLHALQSDAESLNAKADAERASSATLDLMRRKLEAGAISSADLLNAEQADLQNKVALIQARAQRYADTAALFTALGGGWWNRDKESPANTAPPSPESQEAARAKNWARPPETEPAL